ncbi:tetratricopeptide repeat protein [Rugamonas apoptosis]|uniref:Tetratricopeptide repeat protein n=1 Tax=Rugamonas apoptosis TaxID=2758570 RepID=A0A7W2F8V1_9BURK|nr:tetratricopeptide repeat protein [Rugamonas apoptosis]MBA5687296.1 tetratricopeptide repeat protein [Rugamonas apoptosis]
MKPYQALCILLLPGAVHAGVADCGPLIHNEIGGDYTNANDRKTLGVVEQFHFTPDVEHLIRGASGKLGDDIGYTLDHFPNHHRALAAMARLALRDKTSKPLGARYTVECYFDRALRTRADDPQVHSLFGGYLLALGNLDAALDQLREAARLAPENATNQYNLGLLYLRKQNYAEALACAHAAYAKGYPLPGLKNKLAAAGQWRDAPKP